MDKSSPGSAIRIDKWLWHARVVKTRTLARKLVEAGKVRVNRDKERSASRQVRPGDVLTIVLERRILVYEIVAIASRRGPFVEASRLYLDRSPAAPSPPAAVDAVPKPDKRQRRALSQLRGKPL